MTGDKGTKKKKDIKRIRIRLYLVHDLDLVTFVATHEFDILRAIYCVLNSFANGELFLIETPPRRAEFDKKQYKTIEKTLKLDKEKDKKIIDILDKIVDGKRNNFIKNLLRLYLCNPISEDFLKDQADADFFEEKFKIFKKGKRTARAGKEEFSISSRRKVKGYYLVDFNGAETKEGEKTPPEPEIKEPIEEKKKANVIVSENIPVELITSEPSTVTEVEEPEAAVEEERTMTEEEIDDIMNMFSEIM